MSSTRVTGIDWSTDPRNRAAVSINFNERGSHVELIEPPVGDARIVNLCNDETVSFVAVDVPFGWPRGFSHFVSSWHLSNLNQIKVPDREAFRYRRTDQIVRDETRKSPLTVSADRIGCSAHAWATLADEEGWRARYDVTGDQCDAQLASIIEVYPAATLHAIATTRPHARKYKSCPEERGLLLECLAGMLNVAMPPANRERMISQGKDSDMIDAYIAAVTALMRAGLVSGWAVRRPESEEERDDAAVEGWIFFPQPAADS